MSPCTMGRMGMARSLPLPVLTQRSQRVLALFYLFRHSSLRAMEEISASPITASTGQRFAAWFKSEAALRAADLLAGAVAIALTFWSVQNSTSPQQIAEVEHCNHQKISAMATAQASRSAARK